MSSSKVIFSVYIQVSRLWGHLGSRRKKQLALLGLLTLLVSFAEVVSIGAVVPFLSAFSSQGQVSDYQILRPVMQALQIQANQSALLFFTLIFVFASITAGILRITLIWAQTRLSISIGADFSVKVYELTLYQSYASHLKRNTSETLAGSQKANNLVSHIIQPILNILSSLFVLVVVIFTLFSIQPAITISAFLGFAIIYYLLVLITKRQIVKNSQVISMQQGRVIKAVQEGLGGIRDVLIDGTQQVYSRVYRDAFYPMRLATSYNQVLGASPRFGIEALGMVLIAVLAYMFSYENKNISVGVNASIPMLGVLALGVQRLLPLLQLIYTSYIQIKGNENNIQDAIELLDQDLPNNHLYIEPLIFQEKIWLKNLGFKYNLYEPWIFRNINLEIPKGSRFGFIGSTGSGKSTLLDVVMGLLDPTEGGFFIDGYSICPKNIRAWQSHISHVPQSVYLADASIAENIAFGIPYEKIDLDRVKKSAEQAKLSKLIEGLGQGYSTLVGERGVRLSGGQRQRIGIARALYKRANVIIFDEATSALDSETEEEVMLSIEALGREITILIIAHRLTTLRNCDLIYKLDNGGIYLVGDYKNKIKEKIFSR